MEEYWKIQLIDNKRTTPAASMAPTTSRNTSISTQFDRLRLSLVTDDRGGWQAELRRYLKDMPVDVTSDTDIVEWWQASLFVKFMLFYFNIVIYVGASAPLSDSGSYRA
jgi:hypothetical protein